jgi:hypothetical protein
MPTVWRIRFTWVFAIIFGAMSAMGEGLHLLPGQGHDRCCCHEDGDGCCDDNCAADAANPPASIAEQIAALAEPVVLDARPTRTVTDNSTMRLCDDENCAICKVFGQAIWFTQTVAVPDWQFLLRFHRPIKKVVVVCRWEYLPFLSRAPPASEVC